MSEKNDGKPATGGKRRPKFRHSALELDYREAIRAEACMPYEAATHYAIAKQLRAQGVLANMSQQDAEAIVRYWRALRGHQATVLHWRAWLGML